MLYILGTNHNLPPSATQYNLLSQSIETYRQALALTPDTLLESDCAYNLAVGLIELADLAEDFQLPSCSTITPASPIFLDEARVREIRLEARSLMEDVVRVQDGYITSQGGAQAFESDVLGDDIGIEGDEDMSAPTENGGENDQASYETHIPTPSTLIDALLSIADVDISLLGALDPDISPEVLSSVFTVETLSHAWQALNAARKISVGGATSVTPEVKESELVLVLVGLGLAIDLTAGNLVEPSLTTQAGLIRQCLDKLILIQASSVYPTLEVEIKLSFSDTLIELYKASARLNAKANPPLSWEDLGKSVAVARSALELPFSIVTNPLSRASLSLELSKVSVRRGGLDLPAANKNRMTLLKNAETYTNQCLVALGWGWMASEQSGMGGAGSGGTLSIGLGSGAASSGVPPTQGWDHERLARTASLTLLRSLWIASESPDLAPALKAEYQSKAEKVNEKIKSVGQRSADRSIGKTDVERYVEEVVLEESELRDGEMIFWKTVGMNLG